MQKIKDSTGFAKYKGTEDNLQKSVAKYLDSRKVLWCHPPNGGTRNIIEATKLKAMGVKSGVPDCIIFTKARGFAGLALELKVGYNKPSDNQKEYIEGLEANDWLCVVSWSLDHCISIIDWYLGEK